MDIKEDWLQWYSNFFDKKSTSLADEPAKGSGIKSMSNQQLADELHKPIIKKIKK